LDTWYPAVTFNARCANWSMNSASVLPLAGCMDFLRRDNVSSRVCTAISKVRPDRQQTDQEKKPFFYQYVSDVDQKQNIACLWNMDEMPLFLDMPMKRTMEVKGRRSVPYLNTGNERKRISVVLCCSEHGQKMSQCL
jgi:hypothetical protein